MPDFTMLEHLRRPWSFDEPEVREWAALRIESLESKLEAATKELKERRSEQSMYEDDIIGLNRQNEHLKSRLDSALALLREVYKASSDDEGWELGLDIHSRIGAVVERRERFDDGTDYDVTSNCQSE